MKFLDIEPITRQEQIVIEDLETKLKMAYAGNNQDDKPIFLQCMYCTDLVDYASGQRLYLLDIQRKMLDIYKVGQYSSTIDNSESCLKNFDNDCGNGIEKIGD